MKYDLVWRWGNKSQGIRCRLMVNGFPTTSCCGGGFNMQAATLGEWIGRDLVSCLRDLKEPVPGLSWYDPSFDPGRVKIDGQTIQEREDSGKSLGLERSRALYKASVPVPDEKHCVPVLDCCMEELEKIVRLVGGTFKWHGENHAVIEVLP